MDKITKEEFLIRQPNYPEVTPTDGFYRGLADKLMQVQELEGLFKELPDAVVKRICLGLVGYLQDVISDMGVWRSFINECRRLYGRAVPFYGESEEYVDYELNREDIRFVCWYTLAMCYEHLRDIYPFDSRLILMADRFYEILEQAYEDAPVPENYNIAFGLEFSDQEDMPKIYNFGHWLFLHNYLMTPAFALTLGEIMADPEIAKGDDMTLMQKRLETSMMEDPTGPLALFIPEWTYLIVEGKMPKERKAADEEKLHPYYEKFVAATDGDRIKFFGDYRELNEFFINALGWEPGVEHLAQLKGAKDYVILVNPAKGMLVAHDVAACIAAPSNQYYDKDYARNNAIRLLTTRGKCPADLLHYICENNWLPDAVFPGSDNHELVAQNYDFIARCYLQQYYRD